MHAIDRIYTDRPFYGVRRIWKTLRDDGYLVNRKRVHRLMQLMGLQAIYPRKRLSLPDQAHRVYILVVQKQFRQGSLFSSRSRKCRVYFLTLIPMAF